jgi:hypothetical protein
MNDSYHNTTRSSGAELSEYERKALSQDELILDYFQRFPDIAWSPSQVRRHLNLRSPLTSTRRAITNLTTVGLLIKTPAQITGPYGRPEYLWKLARHDPNQGELELDEKLAIDRRPNWL